MKKIAAERGYRTTSEFTFVDDYTGTSLDRPALNSLREVVKSHEVEVVLAYTLDRLSRVLGDVIFLRKEFQRHGATLDFVSMTLDDSPFGEFFFHLVAAQAQCERRQILDRTQRGKEQKARQGYVSSRTFGYRYLGRNQGERGRLEVDEAEAAVVRQIFVWRIEGASLNNLVVRLNEGDAKPMKGGTWNRASVAKILANRTYIGTSYYGRRESVEPKAPRTNRRWKNAKSSAKERPEDKWIPIPVPRIVDDQIFAQVSAQAQRNKETLRGRPSTRYLLRGLLRCGRCGQRCRGHQNSGRPLYRCTSKDPKTLQRACGAGGVSAARLEEQIWASTMDTLSNADILREAYLRHHREIFEAQTDAAEETSHLKEKIKSARRREMNLKEMCTDAVPDAFASLKGEWRIAQERRRELERQLASLPSGSAPAIADDALPELSRAFQKVRDKADREERREILMDIVSRISYADRVVEIECAIPVKRYCLSSVEAGDGLALDGAWSRGTERVGAVCC